MKHAASSWTESSTPPPKPAPAWCACRTAASWPKTRSSGCRPSSRAPPSPWPSTTPTTPRNWPSRPRRTGLPEGRQHLVGHRARTFRPADVAFMHYECELAVVIGKTARNVRRDQATTMWPATPWPTTALRDYLENWYRPNLRVKSRDTCTPLGPWLVDRDDIPDPMNLALSTHVKACAPSSATRATWCSTCRADREYFSSFHDALARRPEEGLDGNRPRGASSGHKIGLTSRAMQQASQIDEPDFGMLLDDMFFQDGAEIPAGRFILPRLEVELAFLGKRLPERYAVPGLRRGGLRDPCAGDHRRALARHRSRSTTRWTT